MPKPSSKLKLTNKNLYAVAPWSCAIKSDGARIEAYVEAAGNRVAIAEIPNTAHVDAEATASYIVRAVNHYKKHHMLIAELTSSLELCLQCDGLTWEAEHEAELAIAKAKSSL